MMDEYYFLVSSLSSLRFDAAPPLPEEKFIAMAHEHLSERDRRNFDAASLNPEEAVDASLESAAGKFRTWETQLRNTLAMRRQSELKLPPADRQRPCPDLVADIPENVNRAYQAATPYEIARELDLMRWNALDAIAATHSFDADFLIVYKLKLAILSKWQLRTAPAGRTVFAECLDKIEHHDNN